MIVDRAQVAAALPQYEIGQVLGRGAHGLVFSAQHRTLGSMRAVKALTVVEDAPETSRRLLTEAQVMTALDHPHIVRVHEFIEAGSLLLLVMEMLASGTLASRMHGAVAPEKAAAWALAVADGLGAAHRRGVVHRDVKPSNLLFTGEGVVKVGDFGIAKLLAGSDASASADVMGTPRYIAPEQITGGRVSPATDIYALGLTLYEMLAGHSPFPPHLPVPGLLHHHLSVPPRPLGSVPPTLAAVVLRALAKEPAERPASALEFARELVQAADRDLGPDWIHRSGVPVRVDTTALKRSRAAAATPEPQSLVGRQGTTAGDVSAASPAAVSRRGRWVAAVSAATILVVLLTLFVDRLGPGQRGEGAQPSGATSGVPTTATRLGSFAVAAVNAEILAISTDGRQVASIDHGLEVQIWQRATGRLISLARDYHAWSLAFDAQGEYLITGGTDGTVRRWRSTDGSADGNPVTGLSDDASVVAVDNDGSQVAAGDAGGVRVFGAFEATVGASLTGHPDSDPITAVALDSNAQRLASAGADGVWLWDANKRTLIKAMPDAGWAGVLRFTPDGTRLASGDDTGNVRLWDADTGAQIGATMNAGNSEFGMTLGFSADSTELVTCATNTLRWHDTTSGRQIGQPLTVHAASPVTSMALNADATVLALGTDDAKVTLYELS